MNEINKLVLLYDFYGELLSDSQKSYFEDYYFNNLSLSEISDNLNVSRNAVHKQLKVACEKLYDFESKLNLLAKNEKLKNIINNIDDEKLKKQIEEIIEN